MIGFLTDEEIMNYLGWRRRLGGKIGIGSRRRQFIQTIFNLAITNFDNKIEEEEKIEDELTITLTYTATGRNVVLPPVEEFASQYRGLANSPSVGYRP